MKITRYYIKFRSGDGTYYLINTLLGSINVIDSKLYSDMSIIERQGVRYVDKNVIDKLTSYKILISEKEEENLIKKAYANYKNKRYNHVAAFFYLSYDCNLSCTYCNYKEIRPTQRNMSNHTLIDSFAYLEKVLNNNKDELELTIVIFGGEPFLKKNEKRLLKFLELYDKFKNKYRCVDLLLFSNGIELPYFTIKYRAQLSLIDSLYITLNGTEDAHDLSRKFHNNKGSYKKVLTGVRSSINANIKTWLVFNSDGRNINHLTHINKLIDDNGWNNYKSFLGCCVSRIKSRGDRSVATYTETDLIKSIRDLVHNEGLSLKYFNFEDMRILKSVIMLINEQTIPFEEKSFFQFNGCGNRIHQYSFTPERMVYPCSPSIGNVELSIDSLESDQNHFIPIKECWTYENVITNNTCLNCSMAFLCGGGCKYSQFKEGIQDFECESIRGLFEAYINCCEAKINILNEETVFDKGANYYV